MPAEAKDKIVQWTTALTQDEDDSDPFADLEDKLELESNDILYMYIVVEEDTD